MQNPNDPNRITKVKLTCVICFSLGIAFGFAYLITGATQLALISVVDEGARILAITLGLLHFLGGLLLIILAIVGLVACVKERSTCLLVDLVFLLILATTSMLHRFSVMIIYAELDTNADDDDEFPYKYRAHANIEFYFLLPCLLMMVPGFMLFTRFRLRATSGRTYVSDY